MMKAASGAWLILFLTFVSTWILCSYAVAPTELSLPMLTVHVGSTDESGENVIHKSMGAQRGNKGAGGGGIISDRPEAVRKSSGSKLLMTNIFTLVLVTSFVICLAVHLF